MMPVRAFLAKKGLYLVLAGAVALVAWGGVQTVRLAQERTDHAETKVEHEKWVSAAAAATVQAVIEARAEERRRYVALQEIADETARSLARARADGAAAVAVAHGLRERLVSVVSAASQCAGDSAAAADGASAGSTIAVFANVQRWLDEAATDIARHADEARIAGIGCERSYNALMTKDEAHAR